MALVPGITLGEARLSVAIRCGQASGNSVPNNLQPIIDEKLRSAQRWLWHKANYVRSRIRDETTVLIPGTSEYDFPDGFGPEGIDNIAIMRASDSKVYNLEPGIRSNERNYAMNDSAPLRYAFENQVIVLFPPPDDTWSKLVFDGFQLPPPFIDPSEVAVVDTEALLLQTELLVKEHFGMPMGKTDTMLKEYLEMVRSRQSDGEGFQLGGKQSMKGAPVGRNRITQRRYRSNVAGDDWQPAGWG